jgi:hypothetical protein
MKRASLDNHQLTLGPMPLRNAECASRDSECTGAEEDDLIIAERITAEIIDAAFTASGLENKEAAHDLKKSVSLIEKWRSVEQCGSPNIAQLWVLGKRHPKFGYAVIRETHKRCVHLTLQACANVLIDFGSIAAAVGL